MAMRLEITDPQLADLERICSLGSDTLRAVAKRLADSGETAFQLHDLRKAIEAVVGGKSAEVESLCRQAVALNGLSRQTGLDPSKITAGFDKAVVESSDSVEFKSTWTTCREHFFEIVASTSARMTAKAIDLAYDYANLYQRARILADVRPLFSEDSDDITGSVISYTLRLRYDNVSGENDLSLAMDHNDVVRLLQECERAIKKGDTAKRKLSQLGMSAFINGDKRNANS